MRWSVAVVYRRAQAFQIELPSNRHWLNATIPRGNPYMLLWNPNIGVVVVWYFRALVVIRAEGGGIPWGLV